MPKRSGTARLYRTVSWDEHQSLRRRSSSHNKGTPCWRVRVRTEFVPDTEASPLSTAPARGWGCRGQPWSRPHCSVFPVPLLRHTLPGGHGSTGSEPRLCALPHPSPRLLVSIALAAVFPIAESPGALRTALDRVSVPGETAGHHPWSLSRLLERRTRDVSALSHGTALERAEFVDFLVLVQTHTVKKSQGPRE